MQKIKSYISKIKDNSTEIWLGLILFVGLPLVASYYLGIVAGIGLSLLAQAIILILFTRKANK